MHPHQRLRRTGDFERVRQQGRTYRSPLLILSAAPALESGQGAARCGLAVSRRVGKAVVRNKLRRRLREIMRRTLPLVAPGWDLVLIARPPAAAASFAALAQTVVELLRRARLLAPEVGPAFGPSSAPQAAAGVGGGQLPDAPPAPALPAAGNAVAESQSTARPPTIPGPPAVPAAGDAVAESDQQT